MGILDFDTTSVNNAKAANPKDRPAAKLWINLGKEKGGRFINLPVGIPADTMEPLPIKGQNEEWAKFQSSRNSLLRLIQEKGDSLLPGEEVVLNLEVRLRKVNDEIAIDSDDNEFSLDADDLFGDTL